MKYTRKILILILCACMTLCTFIPVSAEERTTRITSVKLSDDGKEITVEATLSEDFLNVYGACGVYLFELAPYEKFSDIDRMAPVAELVANANLTFSVDITDGSRTRKYDKFAIARLDGGKYITHGSASYVENLDVLAENKGNAPSPKNSVGVRTESDKQPEEGIGHGIVSLDLSELVAVSADGAAKVEYSDGVYHVDKEALIALDNRVRALSEKNIAVWLEINPGDMQSASSAAQVLFSESGDDFDISDGESLKLYSALTEFLADRYGREDKAYGFVSRYILPRGSAEISAYASLVRLTSFALRSGYAGASLYVSLGQDGMDDMTGLCKALSDVPFGIVWDGSSPDGEDYFWRSDAQDKYFAVNIGDVAAALKEERMLCSGYVRDLAMTFTAECTENTVAALNAQEASLLCAYYQTLACDGVNTFIYNAWSDPEEGKAVGLYGADGTARSAYKALNTLAETDENGIAERLRTLVGEDEFAVISGELFPDVFVNRTRIGEYTGSIPNKDKGVYIADFTDGGSYEFIADKTTESLSSLVAGQDGIILCVKGKADSAGMIKSYTNAFAIDEEYNILVLTLKALCTDDAAEMTLTLVGTKNGERVVLYGTSALVAGQWRDAAFPLDGIDKIEKITVSAKTENGSALTLYARGVELFPTGPDAGERAVRTVMWILLAAVVLLTVLLIRLSAMQKRRTAPQPRTPAEAKGMLKKKEKSVPPETQTEQSPVPEKHGSAGKAERARTRRRDIPEMPKTPSKTYVVPPIVENGETNKNDTDKSNTDINDKSGAPAPEKEKDDE